MNEKELKKLEMNSKYGKYGIIEMKYSDFTNFIEDMNKAISRFNENVIYSDTDSQNKEELICKNCGMKIKKCGNDCYFLGYVHFYNNRHFCYDDSVTQEKKRLMAEPEIIKQIFCKNCGKVIEECDENKTGKATDCDKYKYFHRHNAKHECDTTYAEVKE